MQINTWTQYVRWVARNNLGWHPQAQRFVRWAVVGETTGAGHARSHFCAKKAMERKMVRFGPSMRRWLSRPVADFPPGWKGSRESWRLSYL